MSDRPSDQPETAERGLGCTAVVMRRRIQEARLWAENESQPFVRIIMSVRLRERPTWLIKPGEKIELVSDGLCERDKSLIATCEAWIREIHERANKMVTA